MNEQELIEKIARKMKAGFLRQTPHELAKSILVLISDAGYRMVDPEKLTVLREHEIHLLWMEAQTPKSGYKDTAVRQLAHTKKQLSGEE